MMSPFQPKRKETYKDNEKIRGRSKSFGLQINIKKIKYTFMRRNREDQEEKISSGHENMIQKSGITKGNQKSLTNAKYQT